MGALHCPQFTRDPRGHLISQSTAEQIESSHRNSPESHGSATTIVRSTKAKAPFLLRTAKVTLKTVPGLALVSIPQPCGRHNEQWQGGNETQRTGNVCTADGFRSSGEIP